MSNAKLYRDTHGRVWETQGNHHMANLVTDRNGETVEFDYSAPIGRVRQLFGPIEQIPDDTDPGAERYTDADGDVWYRQSNGRYSMNRGGYRNHPGVPLTTLEHLAGPLVDADDQAEDTPRPIRTMAEAWEALARQQAESRARDREDALTMGLVLARDVHGSNADPADVVATADRFARLILGGGA